MAAEALAFGIDPATLPGLRTEPVWRENLPALEAFLAVSGQWRVAPDGRFIGLDHAAARAGFDLAGIAMTPDLWSDIRLIEGGAREGLNGGT